MSSDCAQTQREEEEKITHFWWWVYKGESQAAERKKRMNIKEKPKIRHLPPVHDASELAKKNFTQFIYFHHFDILFIFVFI